MSLLQFSHHAVSSADHGCAAVEDGAAADVAHQVRVDYAVVQRVKRLRDCQIFDCRLQAVIGALDFNLKSRNLTIWILG